MSVIYTLIYPCYILLYANCQPFHTLICRPYILLFSGVFSVLWSYIGEGDIVIHEFTQLILFEWPIKTPFYFYCWLHFILRPGVDPGFQVRGRAHLKKLRRAEGGAKMFGVFRVKIHDFTRIKQITESPSYP